MNDDLLKRLRFPDPSNRIGRNSWLLSMGEAADRIEALEATLRKIVSLDGDTDVEDLAQLIAGQALRIEALEAAREVDLRECAAQLDQNTATMDVARARIEELEAELERSRSLLTLVLHTEANRAALDKDAGR